MTHHYDSSTTSCVSTLSTLSSEEYSTVASNPCCMLTCTILMTCRFLSFPSSRPSSCLPPFLLFTSAPQFKGPITDHSIKGLPRRCPKLTVLSLAYLRRVTHEAVETVVEDLPLLRVLDVRGVAGKPLTLEGVRELIDWGPSLRTLKVLIMSLLLKIV